MHKTSSKDVLRLGRRAAGVLLHPTSLPGPHGCGDLGPAAYAFVDFLVDAGQRWWQMLPVHPPGPGNAPYSSTSAFAGSPLLISLSMLAAEGLLRRHELAAAAGLGGARVDYPRTAAFRAAGLRRAFARFEVQGGLEACDFLRFCDAQRHWLDDYVLFAALRRAQGGKPWIAWPRELRRSTQRAGPGRLPAALRRARDELRGEVEFQRFLQFQFHRQWLALRDYAHRRGVGLLGDIPIFVAHDSADVWAHPDLFQLEANGRPRTISGVPPDYFSRSGQLWRHPHYRWPRHRRTGFAWWVERFRHTFVQFDAVRVDHFLGFHRVWEVPGRARTARRGRWVRTPGRELFERLRRELPRLEIVAEDLGVVTPEAVRLRDDFGFPGMRLLHFAFGNDAGDRYNQPHNYPLNCVVYPGTHDNETTVGWFRSRSRLRPGRTSSSLLRYLGGDLARTNEGNIHWHIIRLAYASPANVAIIPAQDLLGLGNEARMNTPATEGGNWEWRLHPGALTRQVVKRLREMVQAYERRS